MKFHTTVILVSFKSDKIIEKALLQIKSQANILIIENSNSRNIQKLERKYNNLKVIVNKNNGFGHAANIGAGLAKTRFIIFISPDAIIEQNGIKKIEKIAKNLEHKFGILLPSEKKIKSKTLKNLSRPVGSSIMFFDRNKFLKYRGFDESYFLYYEDIDIQNRFLKKNEKIYKINVIYNHLYGSHDMNFKFEIEVNRNWHYMWSRFYYLKKNYTYVKALIATFPTFLRSIFKMIFYYFINSRKYYIYKGRFFGLLNAYIGKKSWYRPLLRN